MMKPDLLPAIHYPTQKSLADIIEKQMGDSHDPDGYLKREATPTNKQKENRNATVSAIVDGSIN